jgi:hypothetical protein
VGYRAGGQSAAGEVPKIKRRHGFARIFADFQSISFYPCESV